MLTSQCINVQKQFYNLKAPPGLKNYKYNVDVEWSNGSYQEVITLQEVNNEIELRDFEIFVNEQKIVDHYHFFNLKSPSKELSIFTKGKIISYKKEFFQVWWDSNTKKVYVSHPIIDFWGLKNLNNQTEDNIKSLEKSALDMLETAFGK